MAIFRVRAVQADVLRAQSLIRALAAEGIEADLAPVNTRPGDVLIFLWSDASRRIDAYYSELSRSLTQGVGLVACYFGTPKFAHIDLVDWNGEDRHFAGFRDLLRACRRLLGRSENSTAGLSLRELVDRGRGARPGTPAAPDATARDEAKVRAEAETLAAERSAREAQAARERRAAEAEAARAAQEEEQHRRAEADRRARDEARRWQAEIAQREAAPPRRSGSFGAAGDSVDIGASRDADRDHPRASMSPRDAADLLASLAKSGASAQELAAAREFLRTRGLDGLDAGSRVGAAARSAAPVRPPPSEPMRRARHDPPAQPRRGSSLRRVIITRTLAVLALGALWYWRHDVVAFLAGAAKWFGAVQPPPPTPAPMPTTGSEAPTVGDQVDASIYAPDQAAAGSEVLVQVFLHLADDAAAAETMARKADAATQQRMATTLRREIARGQRVDVMLETPPGLAVDEAVQFVIWRGRPCACQFLVSVPGAGKGRTFQLKATLFVGGAPVGSLKFALPVGDAVGDTGPVEPEVRPYRHAFLSYASEDRTEVLKRAHALKAARVGFFHDLLSLEPGERWEKRLYAEIDKCDVFLLFWSSHAAKSDWVLREAEYALARRKPPEDRPEIVPMILEGPPVPDAPEALSAIHFNDSMRYIMAAVEAQEAAPRAAGPPT